VRSLIVSPFAPLPPDRSVAGIYRRLKTFVNGIASFSTEIDFLGLVPEAECAAYPAGRQLDNAQSGYFGCDIRMTLVSTARRQETRWNHYGAGLLCAAQQPEYFRFTGTSQVEAVRRALASRPDLVFVHRLAAMLPVLQTGLTPSRMFFDLDDIDHKVRRRTALERPWWPGKLGYLSHVPALFRAERQGSRRSRAVFVCSDQDARYLRRLGYGLGVRVVHNALPIPVLDYAPVREPALFYIGSFNYKPNRDGAQRLLTRIWPLIRAAYPAARLIIAGQHPEQIPGYAKTIPGVEFTGFVRDLDGLYARVSVAVCPITVGGGTRVKLVEAASYAKPMVSTRIGAEGLALQDGAEILIRESDADFAEACVALLRDPQLGVRLGEAARAKASRLYDANSVARHIAQIMTL
jgi:glycosyltransferase involved in cell wall biosynthesis